MMKTLSILLVLLALSTVSVVAADAPRPIILHPKCDRLPTDLLGPFVKLGDWSVLAADTTHDNTNLPIRR